jgi:hypothetical protein
VKLKVWLEPATNSMSYWVPDVTAYGFDPNEIFTG